MQVLSSMTEKKVCVIVFGGPQSSGKSYLASRYIDVDIQSAFQLAHMQGSGTIGLNMWSKAIPLSESTDVIVIDSQPIFNSDLSEESNRLILQICFIIAS